MKKFLTGAIMLLCFGFLAAAQNIPTFTGEGAEKAILLDIKAAGKVKDNLVLINQAEAQGFVATIYVYDKKNGWIFFNESTLAFFGDVDKVEAKNTKDFGKYNYAAIVFNTSEKYSYKTKVQNSDLYLFVQTNGLSYNSMKDKTVDLNLALVKGKIKDKIRFISSSKNFDNTGFLVFGDYGNGMELVGTAYLKSAGDTCFSEMMNDDISLKKYSAISVAATNGKKFTPKISAVSNDLYIYVMD